MHITPELVQASMLDLSRTITAIESDAPETELTATSVIDAAERTARHAAAHAVLAWLRIRTVQMAIHASEGN